MSKPHLFEPESVLVKFILAATLLFVASHVGTFSARADGIVSPADQVDFTREVVPILADTCLACHGPDGNKRKAELRLDDRQAAIDAGAIAPGDLAASTMIERIMSEDPELIMPPPASHKTLTPEQKDLLRRWIEQGAVYTKHWSFSPPVQPSVPEIKDPKWARNPIDFFVKAKLEELGLEPAPEADLRSLVRRVSLDLTGLPPTPEEIDSVLNDTNPDRYERYVDRLLARETWGEHRGRYWLDYARYADTHGIHFDNYREMYAYRDWVIRAFNQNMPFDQFTIEQLAGDLLPNPTLDQQVATGFHRCNITTNEGGIIDEEYVVLYARDRVETTGAVWLGLTVGCAVCHDHKFDPISQKEFYGMSAFFNNTTQGPRDGNIKDTPPTVLVPLMNEREQFAQLKEQMANLANELASHRQNALEPFQQWRSSGAAAQQISDRIEAARLDQSATLQLHAPLTESSGRMLHYASTTPEIQSLALSGDIATLSGVTADQAWLNQNDLHPTWDSIGDFEANEAFSVALWVHSPADQNRSGALLARMDPASAYRGWDVWVEGGRVAMHIINAWEGNAIKVVAQNPLPADQWSHVSIVYDGTSKAAGIRCFINGNQIPMRVDRDQLSATIKTPVPLRLGGRHSGDVANGYGIQDVRVYSGQINSDLIRSLSDDSRALALAAMPDDKLTDATRDVLFSYYLTHFNAGYATLVSREQSLKSQITDIERRSTKAHVMAEKEGMPIAYILNRGEYDQRRDQVSPITPAVLSNFKDEYPRNRLGFAMWLVSDDHPLTARVTVNRCWQEIFGRGIVSTAGDFGTTGDFPTNQALLDYLAVQFRIEGWDVKQLYRDMVTSSTYRQSQTLTPEKLEKDGDNRYLSRGPRFRMDAEMIRDYALAVSGLLNPEIGGRSVRPYQPPGVWEAVAMPESDTRNYRLDDKDMIYRRSMYTFWKRAAPPASMDILNAPAREVCTVRRERTNTPLQALVTMNDPQFVEAARVLAEKLLAEHSDADDTTITQAIANIVVGRSLIDEELQVVQKTYQSVAAYYDANPDQAKLLLEIGETKPSGKVPANQHAAWTIVINQLMNLDEVLCK